MGALRPPDLLFVSSVNLKLLLGVQSARLHHAHAVGDCAERVCAEQTSGWLLDSWPLVDTRGRIGCPGAYSLLLDYAT